MSKKAFKVILTILALCLWTGNVAALAINELKLSPKEKEVVRYIAKNVLPNLAGSFNEKVDDVATATWWSINEGIARLQNPHRFSNCYPGEQMLQELETCSPAANGKFIWQVGLAGIQVPDYSDIVVSKEVKKLYPNRTEKELLEEAARIAGFNQGDQIFDGIVNSTGILKRSWLLRHPVIGMSLEAKPVKNQCFVVVPKPWCTARTAVTFEQLKAVFIRETDTSALTLIIGNINNTRVIGDCSCSFQLANAYSNMSNVQEIFFGSSYDGRAWININGQDVNLHPKDIKVMSQEYDRKYAMLPAYTGEDVTVYTNFRQTGSCPSEPSECEVTPFDITVTVEKGGLRETVKGKGSCGC